MQVCQAHAIYVQFIMTTSIFHTNQTPGNYMHMIMDSCSSLWLSSTLIKHICSKFTGKLHVHVHVHVCTCMHSTCSSCSGKPTQIYMHCVAGNYIHRVQEISTSFATCLLSWAKFYIPWIFLSHINDYIEPMVTFTYHIGENLCHQIFL